MTSTYDNAIQEMCAIVLAAWTARAPAIVGYMPEIRWPLNESPTLPPNNKYWARVSTQMVLEGEGAVGKPEQGGKGLWDSAGLLYVQCFGPMTGDALVRTRLTQLAECARDAYSGNKTASGVWFRNCRVNDLTPDNKFQRKNAVVEFQYLSIR